MQRRRSRLRPDYRTATMQRLQQHPASRTSATATTRWSTAAKVSAEEEVAPPRPRWRSAAACNCVGSPTELPKPSPICSNSGPTSSLSSELFCCGGSLVSTAADVSFTTANHSFCVMSHDCKEKVKAREQHQVFKNQIPVVKLREIGLEMQRRWRGGRRPESSCSLERERRPPKVGKEEEDEGRRRNLHHCSVPLLPSSDEDYCLGSGSSSCASSDNMVQIRSGTAPGRARRLYTTAETGMKSMDKIAGRKEAITRKLMKKLEDEEASIDAWMKNKTTKAKMEMKQLEVTIHLNKFIDVSAALLHVRFCMDRRGSRRNKRPGWRGCRGRLRLLTTKLRRRRTRKGKLLPKASVWCQLHLKR